LAGTGFDGNGWY